MLVYLWGLFTYLTLYLLFTCYRFHFATLTTLYFLKKTTLYFFKKLLLVKRQALTYLSYRFFIALTFVDYQRCIIEILSANYKRYFI